MDRDDRHFEMDVDLGDHIDGLSGALKPGRCLTPSIYSVDTAHSANSSSIFDPRPSFDSGVSFGSKSRQQKCICSYCTNLETRLEVTSVSDAGLRYNAAADRRNTLAPSDFDDDDGHYLSQKQLEEESRAHSKGKGRAYTPQPRRSMEPVCYFLQTLPVELIDTILSYLSPLELADVSRTCRFLYHQANQDLHWQAHIQANVPGAAVTSPHPYNTYRELYAAHDPRWFLPKHKIWFSGRDLSGKLIIVRFNPNTGSIEGHQMVAVSNRTTYQHWPADDQVIIHAFEPEVRLHLHKPILDLKPHLGAPKGPLSTRFAAETPMPPSSNGLNSRFILTRALDRATASERASNPFPYGKIWPPPSVPARHRIAQPQSDELEQVQRPTRRSEICEQGFHLHMWLEMGAPPPRPIIPQRRSRIAGLTGVDFLMRGPVMADIPRVRRRIGEEFVTYSTLAPWMYTPTPEKPYRGIWVGDYSGHGCEFLLIHQPEDDGPPPVVERNAGETDEEYERREREAKVYRGRLEAIKLTGDPNIPRGEYTFVADELGEAGFVDVVKEEPFAGARVVRSKGHVAHAGFVDDKYIESQLLLISPNRLAQYWVGFGHISFFERVDIDQFLTP